MAERIALLDVNVLIALVDPQHVQHEPSHQWFQAHGGDGWASCPLTQNALLRILGDPRYPNSPGGPDALSRDAAGIFKADALLHQGQITDTYILALAVHHQGTLVSFDRRLSPRAVCGGAEALQLIDPG